MKKAPKPLKALLSFLTIQEKEIWGPVFWKLLHRRAKTGLTKRWLDSFEASIPCPDCRDHFASLRERMPLELFADHEAAIFVWHNLVNTERANKPYFTHTEWLRHKDD